MTIQTIQQAIEYCINFISDPKNFVMVNHTHVVADIVDLKDFINKKFSDITGCSIVVLKDQRHNDVEEPLQNVIYFEKKAKSVTGDIFDEYMYVDDAWEMIGDTTIDLSQYYTKYELYTKAEIDNLLTYKFDASSIASNIDEENKLVSTNLLKTELQKVKEESKHVEVVTDEELDEVSKNPVANKAITKAVNDLRADVSKKLESSDITDLKSHVTDFTIHVTKEDKDLWNSILKQAKEYSDKLFNGIDKFAIVVLADDAKITSLESGEKNTVYFEKDGQEYIEYMYVNGKWEPIGSNNIDLSNYYQKEEVYNKDEINEMVTLDEALDETSEKGLKNKVITTSINAIKKYIDDRSIVGDMGKIIDANDTPVGTVQAFMGTTAPAHYLFCDGTVYNIHDYKELANFFKENYGKVNQFGGDGETTFAVPDLRGEFLRGAGSGTVSNAGKGAEVGQHQNPTSIPWIINDRDRFEYVSAQTENDGLGEPHNVDGYLNSAIKRDYILTPSSVTVWERGTRCSDHFAARPTNTSVNYCIKYEATPFVTINKKAAVFDEAVLFEGSASLDKISYSFPYDITNYDYLLISAKATSNVTIKESELIKVSDITESDLFVIQYSSTDSFTITFKFQDNTKLYIESIEKSGFNTVEITSITGLMAK